MPVGSGARRAFREALREELVSLSKGLFSSQVLNINNLNSVFYCIFYNTDEKVYRVSTLDKYWQWGWNPAVEAWGKIDLPTPREHSYLTVYTKPVFSYPLGGILTKLPDRTKSTTGGFHPFGFEGGPIGLWGLTCFVILNDGNFYAMVSGAWGAIGTSVNINLNTDLPANYTTALHHYEIKVNRMNAEFYIDKVLKAVVLTGAQVTTISGPPYAIAGISSKIADRYPAFLESNYSNLGPYDLAPPYFRAFDGDPQPPRLYELYLAGVNTKFAGYSLAAGTLLSHPIPVYGYENATIKFRANQATAAGNLIVEELLRTGNWRTYEARTYAANNYFVYPLGGDCVLIRLSYTPSAYPAVVEYGEVVLR